MKQAPHPLSPLSLAIDVAILTGLDVLGFKGGETKPRPPVEAPDSLSSIAYANVLDLISEGEIEGLVNGMSSIYLDETPLVGPDGSNFSGVTVAYRGGTQDQEYIQGFPSVENEIGVGVQLTFATPYVRTFTNNQLSGARVRLSVSSLLQQNTTNGDTNGYRVGYEIYLRVGNGALNLVLTSAFDGKATSTYERTHRIDFPVSSNGWTIQVKRTTPDSTTTTISDRTNIVSVTEVIDAKFRYPNSALVGLKFDASQFQSIPGRAFHMRGMKIKIPSNYDPVSRTYTGVWNGTFKTAYCNCPPWVYYDLLTNDRYGLGHLIKEYQIDRYELYRIGQYCDFMVPDGKGGMEPRFTCNLYLQQRADALKVLQDMSAIFRGMSYWGGGGVYTSADMPEDPVYTYSNANVIDGNFQYSGFRRSDRYSVVLVSWCDMTDFGRAKVEYVEDRVSLAAFGHRQTEITAIGCTSQGQAQRLGRWTLLTNRIEAEMITYKVGLDGVLVRPGKIVRIANNNRAGRRIGGRIHSSTINEVILDDRVLAYTGDKITVIMPDGKAISRTITQVGTPLSFDSTTITWDNTSLTWDRESIPEEIQKITVSPDFPDIPVPMSMWAIDSESLATEQYRVLSIKEDFTGEKMEFQLTATKHVPGKFENIDNGTRIESPPITVIPPSSQAPVASVSLASDWLADQGNVLTTMTISWPPAANAVAYEIQWKVNNGSWVRAGRTGECQFQVAGILAGRYMARVQAFNANSLGSVWTTSSEVVLQSKNTPPPALSFLRTKSLVFSIGIEWGYPVGIDLETVRRVEIWQSTTADVVTASKQGEYSYPTNNTLLMGLLAGTQLFFWGRLIDSIGNVGPFVGPIEGHAETNPDVILDYLEGQITQTQLSQGLLEYIETATDLTGVNSRIDQVIQTQTDDRQTATQQYNTATSIANGAQTSANQAQQAAQQASDAAGGKGKVIYGNTPPVAADQLPQNLWIDTTGGANTPKRWNGSSWAPVTDKTATDAASAAAAAKATADTAKGTADAAQATAQTAMTTTADLNGKVSAMYSIKTQVTSGGRTYIAGIGIGVENNGGIIESQVLVAASRFAILDPNGSSLVLPFVVQGGQVILDQALIQKATITNALIGATLSSVAVDGSGNPLILLNFQTGQVSIRSVNTGAGYMTFQGGLISVFRPNGNLKTRYGIWS